MSEANKAVVLRFNRDVIERGDRAAFEQLMSPEFVNRTAPPNMSSGPDGMWMMFDKVLRPAMPDLAVDIHEQVAERDLVTTLKTIRGTHRGELFGVPPTGRAVEIQVIDIVRVRDGRYLEHWGMNTLQQVVASLRDNATA